MRNAVLTLCAGAGLLAAAGCAQRGDPAITADPAGYELPTIPHAERRHIVSAQVEDRSVRPRVRLVPDFEPPELTPEEREVLGEPDEYAYLPYPVPTFGPESRVYWGRGGAETAAHGWGGAEALYGPVYTESRVYSAWGGAATAASSFPAGVAGVGNVRPGAGSVGSLTGGVETATDTKASEVARQRRTIDP